VWGPAPWGNRSSRRRAVATWSGECESRSAWLVDLTGANEPQEIWPGRSAWALGWAPDGRAVVVLDSVAGAACGQGDPAAGVYTLVPGAQPTLVVPLMGAPIQPAMWHGSS
jgi:hypothetical protein